MKTRSGAAEHTVLAVGIPVLFTLTMVLFGQWSLYSHENAYIGLKFAPSTHAGCGVDLLTQTGRDAGLDTFYCE